MEWAEHFSKNGKATRLWNSLWFGVPAWVTAAAVVTYWHFVVPSPGKAIAFLAVVAGFMSIRDIKVLGKISWVILLVVMLLVEFRAIDDDRAKNDFELAQRLHEERQSFRDILEQQANGFTSSLLASQTQFEQTLGKFRDVLTKTQQVNRQATIAAKSAKEASDAAHEGVNNLTGGDSICFFSFFDPPLKEESRTLDSGEAQLFKRGKYPLYGVHYEVTSFWGEIPTTISGELPNMGSGILEYKDLHLPKGLWMYTDNSEHKYVERFDLEVDYMARNGSWHQVIHGFRKQGNLFQETSVTRDNKVVYSHVDPEFNALDDHKWSAH